MMFLGQFSYRDEIQRAVFRKFRLGNMRERGRKRDLVAIIRKRMLGKNML